MYEKSNLNQLYQKSLQKWKDVQNEFETFCNDNVSFVFIKPRITSLSNQMCSFCRDCINDNDCNKCKINKKICDYSNKDFDDHIYGLIKMKEIQSLKRKTDPIIEYGRKTKNKKEMKRWIKMMIDSLKYMEQETRKVD